MSGINPQELLEVFTHTNNVNNDIRLHAERRLAEIERLENYIPTLLQVTGQEGIAAQVRVSIAIRFKNHVLRRWAADKNANGSDTPAHALSLLTERDKALVKEMIYEAIVTQRDVLVKKQLLEAFYIICREDFPTSFGNVMQQICHDMNLSEEHVARVYGSIGVLRMLCKKYQFKGRTTVEKVRLTQEMEESSVLSKAPHAPPSASDTVEIRRNTLDDVLDATLPRLGEIAGNLVMIRNNNNVYEMLKPIFQIFYYGIHMGLPVYLLSNEERFNKWMEILLKFLRQPIPDDLATASRKAAEENASGEKLTKIHPFSKAQKWAVRCVTRVFYDHGRYQYVDPHMKSFARKFQHDMAPIFLECVLDNILKVYGEHCSASGNNNFSSVVYYKTLSCSIMYLTVCVHYGNLCAKILEQFDVIMFNCLYPIVCLNRNDIAMWNDNPHEFVRRLYSEFLEEKYDPRVAALRTIFQFARIRTQYTCDKIVDFMCARVSEYDQVLAQYSGNEEHHHVRQAAIQKDGALAVLGELSYQMRMGGEKFSRAIETVLSNHIVHDFERKDGLLRFRACKFVGQFFTMDMNDELRYKLAECVTTCLNDHELPVQLEAANAFPRVITNDGVLRHLSSTIPVILERYLMLMDEIGIEHVMATFDIMIDRLGDNLAPFAEQLTDRMIAMFNKLHQEGVVGGHDMSEVENAMLSCIQVLKSISTIVFAVYPLRQLLRTVQMKLFPLFESYFNQQNGENYASELLDLIAAVTYYDGPDLHPFLWERVLPNVIEMHLSWNYEFLNKVVNIIANFISLRGDLDLTNYIFGDGQTHCDFIDQFFTLYSHCIKDDNVECDSLGALTDVIFSYLRDGENTGGVPNAMPSRPRFTLHKYIPQLLTECCDALNNTMIPGIQNCALHTIAAAMFYDAKYFITTATQQGVLEPLLSKFRENMEDMTWPEQKIVVFGFSQLMSINLSELPPFLIEALPATIDMIATLVCFMNYDAEDGLGSDEAEVETTTPASDQVDDTAMDKDDNDNDKDGNDAIGDLFGYDTKVKPFLALDLERDYTDAANLSETARARAMADADDATLFEYLDQFGDDHILPNTPFEEHDEVIAFNGAIQCIHAQNSSIVETWKKNIPPKKLAMLEGYLNLANENMQEYDKRKMRAKQKEQESEARLTNVMKEASGRQQQEMQGKSWLT